MKPFDIGEKLFLVHTGEEVTVTRIENNRTLVYVQLGDDEIPVDAEFLSYAPPKNFLHDALKKEVHFKKTEEEIKIVKPEIETGISVALEPLSEKNEIKEFKIYFVNGFFEEMEIKFQFYFFNEEHFVLKKKVESQTAFHLLNIGYDELNESPSFEIKVFGKYNNLIFDSTQKIKPQNLFNKEKFEPLIGKTVYSYRLLEEYPASASTKATADKPLTNEVQSRERISDEVLRQMILEMPVEKEERKFSSSVEVDLHIQKITRNFSDLSNEEIVQIQLAHFEKALDNAIVAGLKTFYVIHGKGKGILRTRVNHILKSHPSVKSFNNNFHPRYEFGATEIMLK